MAALIPLLLIGFPVLEIYVLIQVGGRIGLVNTLFALVAAGVLGGGFAKAQGRFIQQRLQQTLVLGQVPAKEVIHGLLVFVGGILFLIPGFVSDVVAVLFVVPGPRHLMVALIRRKLESQLKSGKFKVFTSSGGFGASGGFRANGPFRRPGTPHDGDQDFGRDVTPKVIDVTPISSSSRQHEAGESDEGDGNPPKA